MRPFFPPRRPPGPPPPSPRQPDPPSSLKPALGPAEGDSDEAAAWAARLSHIEAGRIGGTA